jgi:TolA-binding protein
LGKPVQILLLASMLSAGVASAQDYTSMGISAVVSAADMKLQRGDYFGAIQPLQEVIRRTRDLTDPRGLETLQTCRFQLARAFYQTESIPAGMDVLKDYLEAEPRKQERVALRMLAQGYFEEQEWEKIEEVAQTLLGLEELTEQDLYNGNLFLGQSLFRQEKWTDCIDPLKFAADNAVDDRTRGLCHIMIVRALVEAENWNELFGWIPRLYRTDAKYDITLNLTLMKAGKARFEQDDYLNALLLYRMVLSREVLVNHANSRIKTMSDSLAADMKVGIKETDIMARQQQIDEIKESMKILDDLPPYEEEVTFRIGQIYYEVKRYWEGYVLFDKLYQQDRNSDIGEASMLQSVLILYDVKEIDRAEERILLYLDEKPDGQYARTLASMLLRDRLAVQKNFDKVVALKPYVDAMPTTEDQDELSLQADLHYMMAFGYFQRRDFKDAGEQFSEIVTGYKNSVHYADARYFRAFSYQLQGKYQEALTDFLSYQEKYPEGEYIAPAVYREAICNFGLEKIPEAEKVFTKFINTFPDDNLVSEAYSMRGDIEAAKDGNDDPATPDVNEYDPHTLDRALADYRKAIDKATTPIQASYPAFKAAEVFKLEFKWQEIIDLMNYYMDRWEEMADVAEAVFWIGRSQIELGQVNEAVEAYIEAIERFGNEREREGVDKIILELIKVANYHLVEEDREVLVTRIKTKLSTIDERLKILKLRLRVAQAKLEGEEAEAALGAELLASGQDLKLTSTLSLSLLCDAAVTAGDTEQMQRLYDYFLTTFEESDLTWHAYRALTFKKLAEEDYAGVLATIEEVQSLYGADEFMGWAQILLADTLFKQKKYEEAEAAYNMIMGVAEWRGPLYAEAMYGMGQCRIGREDLATAHSFFQRTYLLFKSYEDGAWAAKGYLAASDALLAMGKEDDAINTWNAMLEDEYTNTHPLIDEAKKQLKKYGGQ